MIVQYSLGAAIAILLVAATYFIGRARRWGHIYASVPPPPPIDIGSIFTLIISAIATVIAVIL